MIGHFAVRRQRLEYNLNTAHVNVSRNVSLAEGICLLDVHILLKYQLWVVLRGL